VLLGSTLHPTLKNVYDTILLPYFVDHILVDQSLLDTEESQKKLLSVITDLPLREKISQKLNKSRSKWDDVVFEINEHVKKGNNNINPLFDIVFTYTYPRLDINVSTGLNHLLKSPFCIHPSTGAVCVPIYAEDCENFSPKDVPHVEQLIQELDNFRGQIPEGKTLKEYKKTSLVSHIANFKKMFLHPMLESIKQEHGGSKSHMKTEDSLAF